MVRPIKKAGLALGAGVLAGGMIWGVGGPLRAQQAPAPAAPAAQAADRPVFRADVDLVVHSFTVKDNKGKYVPNLKPGDFRILEDGIEQKIVTFSEGNKPPVQVLDDGSTRPLVASGAATGANVSDEKALAARADSITGTNVFVLFDTSNYMYRGFVYASDAIADFIRGLDRSDNVAVYTFSRNLSRASTLTGDRNEAITGLRKAVAGDDAALYNALLLALRDAAKVPGRKVVIVFSNGPDNASMVAPDDVKAVAEDEGIPLYIISTSDVSKDPISTNVFRRISTRTGGDVYFAKTWQRQVEAFEAIRDSLGNSYTVTYTPKGNTNQGFRSIKVDIPKDVGKKWKIDGRPGYRPNSGGG